MRLEYLLFRAITYNLIAVAFQLFQILSSLNSNPSNRKIEGGYSQIRSSAWLEHYTDNVGVSSSNLLGSTAITDRVSYSGGASLREGDHQMLLNEF